MENKKDNRLENLEILTKQEHQRLHASTGRTYKKHVCPNCHKEFTRLANMSWNIENPRCSRKCNGELSRKIQLGQRSK